jgi:Protein of unknown function (DUF559)
MRDVPVAQLAGRQFNRVSREQLRQLGVTERAIAYAVAKGRLVFVGRMCWRSRRCSSRPALARALRESVRLELTTVPRIADALGRAAPRCRSRSLAQAIARYAGLPIERARSGAEVRAMEVLRDAGHPLPELNERRAGEEADLSWTHERLIIEIDGVPFHLDAGEDARKQAIWESAGWTVRRLSSDAVYHHPAHLLALAAG